MIRTLVSTFVIAAALCCASGCGQKQVARAEDDHSPAPPPINPSANAEPIGASAKEASKHTPTTLPFSGPGIQLTYGDDWQSTQDADCVLMLIPSGSGKASDVSVSTEVPKLPPHVPGLIPLGSVVKGYVDDMKKQHANVHFEQPTVTKVAGANARRVVSTWTTDGKELSEEAVLTIHSDRVYIFRANADEPNRAHEARALDALLESVHWQ